MTTPGRRRLMGDGTSGWFRAVLRGFLIFLLIAGVGVAAAVATLALAAPRVSSASALRIGLLYLGPFHHVALVLEGDLAVDVSRLPGSGAPVQGSATLEVGVALLAVTALAIWLLFRAGRASAVGHGAAGRALSGSRVALGYAPPVLVVALLASFEEPAELGSFVTGGLRVSLSTWQALVFPLAISVLAGAFGGLWSWAASAPDYVETGRTRAILAGGWVMFLLALVLSYAGLLVAGIVQPDEPVATVTPSTARYFTTVFERPGLGAAVLAHHLALAPNEALWTLVPAAGACDVVRGGEDSDLLCYGRFPSAVSTAGEVSFGGAPAGYLAFLLVPAVATIAGGRWAAATAERPRGAGAAIGAAAGVVFGLVVLWGCLLSSVTLSYDAVSGANPAEGHLWVGPDPVSGTLVALAWGLAGGAIGGASVGVRSPAAARRPAG